MLYQNKSSKLLRKMTDLTSGLQTCLQRMSIHSHEQVHTPHTQRDDDSPERTEEAVLATQKDNLTLSENKGGKKP